MGGGIGDCGDCWDNKELRSTLCCDQDIYIYIWGVENEQNQIRLIKLKVNDRKKVILGEREECMMNI